MEGSKQKAAHSLCDVTGDVITHFFAGLGIVTRHLSNRGIVRDATPSHIALTAVQQRPTRPSNDVIHCLQKQYDSW